MSMSKTARTSQGNAFSNELAKTRLTSVIKRHFPHIVEWIHGEISQNGRKKDKMCAYFLSDTLAADLNQTMNDTPPTCVTVQLLLLAEGFMPVLLTLYDSELLQRRGKNTVKSVRSYTAEMAQKLKASLMNFCCCEFVLLRFALDETCVTVESLKQAYQEQLEGSWFYSGPDRLDSASFSQLKEATITLSAATPVPSLLQDQEDCEVWLLLPEQDWRDALYLLIEALTDSSEHIIYQMFEGSFKMKVALLEAARRLSVQRKVVIVTKDTSIQECAEKIKMHTRKEFKLVSRLVIREPSSKTSFNTGSEIVIFYDCPVPVRSRSGRLRSAYKTVQSPSQNLSFTLCTHRVRPYDLRDRSRSP